MKNKLIKLLIAIIIMLLNNSIIRLSVIELFGGGSFITVILIKLLSIISIIGAVGILYYSINTILYIIKYEKSKN